MITGCGGGGDKSQTPYTTVADLEREFAASLTAADTAQVLSLGNELLDSLKSGNLDDVLATICELDSAGAVVPLNAERREALKQRFKAFPVRDYELDYYEFSMPLLNDLKYRTYFVARDDEGKGGAAMSLMLNPIYVSGEWYLCVKEASQPAKDATNALNPNLIIGK